MGSIPIMEYNLFPAHGALDGVGCVPCTMLGQKKDRASIIINIRLRKYQNFLPIPRLEPNALNYTVALFQF